MMVVRSGPGASLRSTRSPAAGNRLSSRRVRSVPASCARPAPEADQTTYAPRCSAAILAGTPSGCSERGSCSSKNGPKPRVDRSYTSTSSMMRDEKRAWSAACRHVEASGKARGQGSAAEEMQACAGGQRLLRTRLLTQDPYGERWQSSNLWQEHCTSTTAKRIIFPEDAVNPAARKVRRVLVFVPILSRFVRAEYHHP